MANKAFLLLFGPLLAHATTPIFESSNGTSSSEMNSEEIKAEHEAQTVERTIILVCLLGIATLVGAFLKKHHSKYFGESAAQIVVGFVIGALLWGLGKLFDFHTGELLALDSELFYVVLLPPIIYDAGYATKQVKFFKNFHTILGLAFLGTLFSALVGALLCYLGSLMLFSAGLLGFEMTALQALLYGALLSATDTVSVLSVLSHMPIDKNLYILLFGEAALNDAVAIILFRLFFQFAEDGVEQVTAGHALETTFIMFGVFLGSIALGLFWAMLLALILKHFPLHQETEENLLVLLAGYLAYLLAEHFHLSGIVAILFAGIGMSQYVSKNLSNDSKRSSKGLIRLLSLVCESAVFIYLGLAAAAKFEDATYNWPFIILSLGAVVTSRIHVFGVSAMSNYFPWFKPNRHIPLRQQMFLWFANLRGGIAYVLALQVAEASSIWSSESGKMFRDTVLGTVLALVFLTVVFGGGLTPLVIKWLGLLVQEEGEDAEELQDAPIILPNAEQFNRGRASWLVKAVKGFNKRVMLPFFTSERPVYSASFSLEEMGNLDADELDRDAGALDFNGRKFLAHAGKEGNVADLVRGLPAEYRSWSSAKHAWIIEVHPDLTLPVLRQLVLHEGLRTTDAARQKLKELDAEVSSRATSPVHPAQQSVSLAASSSGSDSDTPQVPKSDLRKEFQSFKLDQ